MIGTAFVMKQVLREAWSNQSRSFGRRHVFLSTNRGTGRNQDRGKPTMVCRLQGLCVDEPSGKGFAVIVIKSFRHNVKVLPTPVPFPPSGTEFLAAECI
jgi:hypothetical protein